MARYIDADKLKEKLKELRRPAYSDFGSGMLLGNEKAQAALEMMPTADVVEVVRCKDCTRRVDYEGMIMCNKFGHKFQGEWYGLRATTEDHYCSYGEMDVSKMEITTEGDTSDA